MKYKNGFLSADIDDSKSLSKIGKEVEKNKVKFNHFAMDRCYYKVFPWYESEYTEIEDNPELEIDELDKAIKKQKDFVEGKVKN
ncbi:hypothetical protein CMI47_20525 [Candidatus Pacearchaeota archaeon]|nr:hypothetical protein [Candidatus Pacearchaeota archaeon]